MSDCTKGGRLSYDSGVAAAAREEYIRQLESRVRDLIEFDTNVRQRKLADLKADNAALSKQLEAERDIRARKNARIEKLEIENEKLRDLVHDMWFYPEWDGQRIHSRIDELGIGVG